MSKELAKTYDPKGIEERLYKKWMDNGYFHHHINLYIIALMQFLARNLLLPGKHCFRFPDLQRYRSSNRISADDLSGDDLMFPALKLLHHLATLCLPDALADHMLGCLSRNTAKLLGLQRNIHHRPDFCFLIILICVVQQDFGIGVFHCLHYCFADCHLEFSLFRINFYLAVFAPAISVKGRVSEKRLVASFEALSSQ